MVVGCHRVLLGWGHGHAERRAGMGMSRVREQFQVGDSKGSRIEVRLVAMKTDDLPVLLKELEDRLRHLRRFHGLEPSEG